MSEQHIYNLQFPDYIKTLNIGGYKFKRIKNYPQAFAGLQHIVHALGAELPMIPNTGTHQFTAIVEIPKKEKAPILPWDKKYKHTRLNDVLLLLSLFTGRNVFSLHEEEEKFPITRDPRGHYFGGQFELSAIQDFQWRNKKTGECVPDDKMDGKLVYDSEHIDLGLEQTINKVLNTISTNEWKEEFGNGYFLFLFHQALDIHNIEPVFLLCWTIWEHLFALHNRNWLDQSTIEKMSADNKISFIINKYLLIKLDASANKEIKRITKARNRLVHFGMKPANVDYSEMDLFIRCTEQIVSITLGLKPNNAFNSIEQLKKMLKIKQ
jgi:hypothetical protein